MTSFIVKGNKGTEVTIERVPPDKVRIAPSGGRKIVRKFRHDCFIFKDELFYLPAGF